MELISQIFSFIVLILSSLLALGLWLVDNIVILVILIIALAIAVPILRAVAGVLKIVLIAALILLVVALIWWLIPNSDLFELDSTEASEDPIFVL